MRRTVLLVSTASRWFGTARMPRELTRAGFDVALLAPKDSLAANSRYVSRIGLLAATATPMEWLLELIHMVDENSPEALVPCDEMAVRLLIMLALEPPPGFNQALTTRLVDLVVASMGDPRFYAVSIDKTKLPPAAEALGIRVPEYAIATGVDDAMRHAAALRYPVVIKRRFGFAGEGVAIVSTPDEAAAAAQQLLRPDQLDLGESRSPELLVQAFITGAYHSQALVARSGVPLASFAWERYVATNPVKGQTAVLRFIRSPETLNFSEILCRSFGISGFLNVQFVIDSQTGNAHLLEINRRIVTHTHLGERAGSDLASAFFNGREGSPNLAGPADQANAPGIIAVFPREWLRDPCSQHLVEFPVDVPWDDPTLLAAMLALRHEQ